jgi:hypothetical protein
MGQIDITPEWLKIFFLRLFDLSSPLNSLKLVGFTFLKENFLSQKNDISRMRIFGDI